jgi:hypothetical protein
MTQGLPILYTRNQGIDGYFQNGDVGYAINPSSYDQFKEAILNIKREYTEISRRAVEKSLKFKWIAVGERLKEIYHSVGMG